MCYINKRTTVPPCTDFLFPRYGGGKPSFPWLEQGVGASGGGGQEKGGKPWEKGVVSGGGGKPWEKGKGQEGKPWEKGVVSGGGGKPWEKGKGPGPSGKGGDTDAAFGGAEKGTKEDSWGKGTKDSWGKGKGTKDSWGKGKGTKDSWVY